jgi:hypothetical protein
VKGRRNGGSGGSQFASDFRVRHFFEIPKGKRDSLLLWKLRNRKSYDHLQFGQLDCRHATTIGCDIKVTNLDGFLPPHTVQSPTDGNAPQPSSFVLHIGKLATVPCKGKHFLNDVFRVVLISENPPSAPVDQWSIGIDKLSPFDRQRNSSQRQFLFDNTIYVTSRLEVSVRKATFLLNAEQSSSKMTKVQEVTQDRTVIDRENGSLGE